MGNAPCSWLQTGLRHLSSRSFSCCHMSFSFLFFIFFYAANVHRISRFRCLISVVGKYFNFCSYFLCGPILVFLGLRSSKPLQAPNCCVVGNNPAASCGCYESLVSTSGLERQGKDKFCLFSVCRREMLSYILVSWRAGPGGLLKACCAAASCS